MGINLTQFQGIIKLFGVFFLFVGCQASSPYDDLKLPSTPVLNIQTYYGVIQSPYLRIRDEARQDSSASSQLRRGVIVEILSSSALEEVVEGKKGRWYQVQYQGRRGWVFGSYIQIFDSLDKARNGVKNLR